MFCGSELGIRWWSGKWWSGKLLSVWRMWMLHLDRPCGNVGTQVGGIICKHRQTFSNWFAHNLPTRNEQPSAAIAFGVLIDWISIFCRPRTFELQRSGDVKNGREISSKIRAEKDKFKLDMGGIRNFWHSLLASSPTLFTLPSLLTGGWLIIIGPIPMLALADSSLVPRRFRSFTYLLVFEF